MVRNRKAGLPKDHPDKGKRNGAGQQKTLGAKTAAAVQEVDSRWQAFNDTNLATAVRQKDAAEWRAALSESAYKEVYTTATQSMLSAGRIVAATASGAALVRSAGEAASSILVSESKIDRRDGYGNLDLDATFKLAELRKQYEPVARAASNTRPLIDGFRQLREIDKRARRT